MQNLSLQKIFLAIVGIIALCHLDKILDAIGAIYCWFGDRLAFIDDFPDGAQAAIAFSSILLIVVIVYKTMNRKF